MRNRFNITTASVKNLKNYVNNERLDEIINLKTERRQYGNQNHLLNIHQTFNAHKKYDESSWKWKDTPDQFWIQKNNKTQKIAIGEDSNLDLKKKFEHVFNTNIYKKIINSELKNLKKNKILKHQQPKNNVEKKFNKILNFSEEPNLVTKPSSYLDINHDDKYTSLDLKNCINGLKSNTIPKFSMIDFEQNNDSQIQQNNVSSENSILNGLNLRRCSLENDKNNKNEKKVVTFDNRVDKLFNKVKQNIMFKMDKTLNSPKINNNNIIPTNKENDFQNDKEKKNDTQITFPIKKIQTQKKQISNEENSPVIKIDKKKNMKPSDNTIKNLSYMQLTKFINTESFQEKILSNYDKYYFFIFFIFFILHIYIYI